MRNMSDIVTVSLSAAALLTLVYAKDRPIPTPGVRTAVELIGNKSQVPLDITTLGGFVPRLARRRALTI